MKLNTFIKVKVFDIIDRSSFDGQIHWKEIVVFDGENTSTITCDSKVAEQLKVGQGYTLGLKITEVPKAYKNGTGAYMENKFKIVTVINDK